MAFRITIGRKISMGFGLFIFFALLVVILTNRTLERSRSINDEINNVYAPSVDALVRLRNLTVSSHMLIKHWALLESRTDAPEKTNLVDITNRELPQLLDRIDTLMGNWEHQEVALMGQITVEMRELFDLHERIKSLLPSLESYSDPFIHMERNDIAEEGGPLDQHTHRVLADLDRLLEMQEKKRVALGGGMIRSFDSLKFIVLYLGIALVIIGTIAAILLVRGIVSPVQRLRSVLLSLGRGVFPRTKVHTTNDEIGDMGKALTSLVEGLRRTTDFSHAVAAGNFEAEFLPMSDEDMLGHALLKMRDELGQRERILEMKVIERTEEVVRQKQEVEHQSRKVVELYKNVTDSIRYAKRLQDSILPPEKRMRELLPESFVYYRPKDIVSGDFYWMERVDDRIAFAAVDCTGHGVPGAFMSLIGHNGLNQAVKEQGRSRPSDVLKVLNKLAFEALHKDREQFLVRDGMDMALCNYDPAKKVLEYSGANSPLYVVREGEVLLFRPDKRPIGSFELEGHDFTDHRINLQAGDMVYIFSDGYADQFGGPKGKKFLYKRFRELLMEISKYPTAEQQRMLEEAFRGWRGTHEQVDDILVMGMRA
ncbi:MAG: SpoIIE family protein phosphatase [Flavobacteriales bacterium]|jgi:serine phosphatase RsbU (regulator of sigma subunit)/HAMP domain-containing protein|nr:SpoIIE family protein phosphatase [Flavobacteriales bacterium]MBK6881477.1 SpoIIE family protein phosphatase [Flavobacteriales bacterium]MBK7102794.1 SpoIIE family protein phosphatase [Flavobacteriales bacterium]MBK7113600.1 SpoIIE family protein phosphatase [Flavobacteriales bacterium]MBK7482415.1 SpoIIE family protein phosphatase [Flavobacteriales bacterium]